MGKVLFYNADGLWGRTWTHASDPFVGALSSIFDPVFGVRTLQSFSLQTSAPVGSFSLECPSEPLYLHVVNSHISFQIFFPKCFLGVLQAGKAQCVCVTAHNKRITEFFFNF